MLVRSLSLSKQALLLLLVGTVIRVPALISPISEGYRNAQTATLTAGMIENGQLRLDPIAPWRGDLDARLTMELPLYNLTALAINTLPGIRLDMAGRLASLIFWILSFLALQTLWRRTLPPQATFWANLLFIFSPMNWYLSTAFMPESLLQLLAIVFMVFALDYARKSRAEALVGMSITGLLGLLVKLPSFIHLGLFAALVLFDRQGWKALFRQSIVFSSILVVLVVLAWGEYIKAVNAPYFSDWAGWANVVGFIRPEASRLSLGYYLPLFGYNLAFIVTIVGAPFVLIGLWQYGRTFSSSFVSRVWIYLFLSLIVSWLIWGKGAPSQNYYNLPNLVFFCAALATGLGSVYRALQRRGRTKDALQVAGLALAVCLTLVGAAGERYLSRRDTVTVAAADWIREHTASDDMIVYQPRHSPSVMDYQHQALLSHLTGRRSFIWTRGTADWERRQALNQSKYLIISSPPREVGFLESVRRTFRGNPSGAPDSIDSSPDLNLRPVYTTPELKIFALRR